MVKKILQNTRIELWRFKMQPITYLRNKLHILQMLFFCIFHVFQILILTTYLRVFRKQSKIIGICLLEHLGDIVASEPISRYMRSNNPNGYIIWFVRYPYKELVQYNPNIDKVITLFCFTEWLILKYCIHLDSILELHVNRYFCKFCQIKVVKNFPASFINLDNYYFYGNLLNVFAVTSGISEQIEDSSMLYLPKKIKNEIDSFCLPREYVIIHGSSNDKQRDWCPDAWLHLVKDIINSYKITVIEIGINSVLKEFKSDFFVNMCGRSSILQTAEMIKRSNLFIGIDSGPAHIANAFNVHGIILLGSFAKFKKYMPYNGSYGRGVNVDIIYSESNISEILPELVFDKASNFLSALRSKIKFNSLSTNRATASLN